MVFQGSRKFGAAGLLIALCAVVVPLRAQRVGHNVPAGIQISRDLGRVDSSAEINITVHLKLNNNAAFDKAVDALYDPASPTYHKWMTNADLMSFAPSEEQRESVRQELRNHGLTILSTDKIGFTIRARGTIASVESAFNTEIHQFEYKGRSYRANIRDAHLSGEAENYVHTVAGLESHQGRPLAVHAVNPRTQKPFPQIPLNKLTSGGFPSGVSTTNCLTASATYDFGSAPPTATYSGTVYDVNSNLVCNFLPSQLWTALGLDDVFANGYTGAGQSIALVEGYGYPTLENDANAFFKMAGLSLLSSSNFRIVYPEGKPNPSLGVLTGWNIEMALDIDWAHTIAPGAKIVEVITNGQDSEDFQGSILYIAENGLANTVSNSYEPDLDLIAGPLEQTSWDSALEVATAKGISVNFSTGDNGDDGLGTPLGAPGVPSVAPHATAVGGTSILNDPLNPGATITTAWGDTLTYLVAGGSVFDPPEAVGLQGGGGGGESIFWPKPNWQHALPGTGRQTPDVSALSDPYTGVPIVITLEGQQVLYFGWGGTSLGCPIFSGFWAIANEKAGHALGQAARAVAALPYGGIQDVLPTSDNTANNVTASITDTNGTTDYTAAALFGSLLEGNKGFTSALWPPDPEDLLDFGFGLDSSFIVRHGWDNATGYGTPYGMTFIDAVTK